MRGGERRRRDPGHQHHDIHAFLLSCMRAAAYGARRRHPRQPLTAVAAPEPPFVGAEGGATALRGWQQVITIP